MKRELEMDKDNELKESVKEPIKELVKEIVSDTAYKLAKASAKKAVIALRDRLKEEAAHRLEDNLKEAAEKRLKQTAQKLGKEFSQDTHKGSEYISKIKQSLEKGFQKLISPLAKGLLKTMLITSVCALVVGGVIGWRVADHFIEPTPPLPQPDLVISEITFDIELIAEEEFPSEELGECPPSYQLAIHYTIENQGGAEAGQSISCLYLCGEAVAEDVVNPLAAGETAEGASFYYPFLRETFYLYFCYAYNDIDIEICADCGNNVDESNEENNHVTLKFNRP